MTQKKYFISTILFFIFFFGIFFATSQKASALCYSAWCQGDRCGPKNVWVNYGTFNFNIASPAEIASYTNVRVVLSTCDYGKSRTLINGTEIANFGPAPTCQDRIFIVDISSYLHVGSNTFYCDGLATDSPDVHPGCTIIPGAPPTCSLTAAPPIISIGGSATLTWLASGATSASIDNGIDISAKPPEGGSASASPTVDTTYTFTGSDGCSNFTCQALVEVNPPSCVLSADSDKVFSGGTVQLSWATIGGDSSKPASIDNGIGNVPVGSGSVTTGAISSDITYNMTFTGIDDITYTCSKSIAIAAPPVGGIVPCGRLADNPVTPYNEKEPCTLCHIFIMLQIISTFVIEIGGIVAVLFLVVGGLIYATSAGSQNRMELGKKTIMWAIFGLAIIFLSWLIVTIVLTSLGYINPLGGQWNIVGCGV